ncbi:MAG TPA: YfhO family protein [Candidatus Coprenecus stercoravium]|uniref:YfhO family protein n=1 Tax=Candidatus Coprenecus stercoravium TaxID=2840735 RepID=A0A9D2K7Z9_9BACT|nr:YfhO family protein [Candidatus Coprenecus stercoravium]
MNVKKILKKALPYAAIVVGFVVIAYGYAPQVLQGKIVDQSDISSWNGMAHEIVEWNSEHPDDPALWTGSMFSGMPATQISVQYKGDATTPIYDLLFWGERPPSYLIISMLGGFLLFLAFGVNPWLAAVGAVAVTFCSYNMQIIQVGHNSKMVAIAFMPWVLAALVYAYRRNAVLGAVFFALTLGFQIKANHPQITYYLAFIVFGYAIAEFCGALRSRTFPKWLKASVLVLAGGLLGIATNANKLIPTYEYAEYTMRGGSELTHDEDNQTGDGLKLDYATAWSYGIEETPNLLIPNFNGGASSGELSRESATYKYLRDHGMNAESLRMNMPLYWGPQPFTAGPMYLGAVSLFLFVFGLCVIKGRYKWWIAGVSLLALLLAWGSHFMWFSELFFKYVPLYNKFRTVSMILVILQITVPLMGILGVNAVFFGKEPVPDKRVRDSLFTALGVTGGICLLFALFPSLAGDFASSSDAMFGNNAALLEAIRDDRRHLLRSDAFRSLILIALTAAVVFSGWKGSLKSAPAVVLLGVFLLGDLWDIDKRYLNKSHFVTERNFDSQFNPRPVDNAILQDTDLSYRVLDLSVNTFNDAIVSYHHKTIGGYSPAKLQRYQDLIDFHIVPEMRRLIADINSAASTARTMSDISESIGYYPVLSMLNTKYIVLDGGSMPLAYDKRLGNGWFVSRVRTASTADAEMAALGEIDPAVEAVIFEPQAADGTVTEYPGAAGGNVTMTYYSPNRLRYDVSAPAKGLAVFSEVWYPAGWKAFVDGKEAPVLRADYALRAVLVEEGDHEVEFVFDPESFTVGKNISLASSLTIILLLAGCILYYFLFANKRKLPR